MPLPALRERPDDIVHFARAFLAQANVELGRRVAGFTDACERALRRHPWPGNLRELRNQVRRMVLLATTLELDEADLTLGPATPGATSAATGRLTELADEMLPLAQRMQRATDALEATILTRTLAECEGNKAAAARALQIDYTTLHRKLKRHGLQGD